MRSNLLLPAGTLQQGSGGSGTVGALDLGGSSLEVTFASEAVPWKEDAGVGALGCAEKQGPRLVLWCKRVVVQCKLPAQFACGTWSVPNLPLMLRVAQLASCHAPCPPAVNVTVLDATHQLYAHVHHHYGLNDAFDRAVTLLLARQQAASGSNAQQQQQQQQVGPGGGGGGAASGAQAHEGRAAAEQPANAEAATGAGTAAEAVIGAAADTQGVVSGGRRNVLQAPSWLFHRLRLTADAAVPLGSASSMQQLSNSRHLLDGSPEVEHPCLHSGYRKAYRRRQQEGAAVPDPPEVVLVGR